MPLVASKTKGKKSDAVIMADATDRLLSAAKKRMLQAGPIDYRKLAKEGFSAEMIARMKEL